MNTEVQCERYTDGELRELAKLGPLNTTDDTKAIDVVCKNLGGEKAVEVMRQHIDHCLKCQSRIEQVAA